MMKIALLMTMAVSVTADKTAMIRGLLSRAVPTENSMIGRNLEQNYQVDISKYNLKFQQCQFIKTFDQELAAEANTESVLATKRFALFRLCPNGCSSCNYNFGEYLVDLETYLQYTAEYYKNFQQSMCNACQNDCANNQNENANGNNANNNNGNNKNNGGRSLGNNNNNNNNNQNYFYGYTVDCTSCAEECDKIENMQNNGYIDATEFLQCQMIYDPQDDNKAPLYAGPICASYGTKIKIGVFTDQYCLNLDSSKEVDDYMMGNNGQQMKLSHALLKNTYTDTCIPCLDAYNAANNNNNNNNNGQNANNNANKVIQTCEKLYQDAGKCEKSHGFDSGYENLYAYENQVEEESTVCQFMNSIKSGTYDETGEIVVSGSYTSHSAKSTTGGQKFALTFFILGTVGLAFYAAMLHSRLVKGSKSTLTPSVGTLS